MNECLFKWHFTTPLGIPRCFIIKRQKFKINEKQNEKEHKSTKISQQLNTYKINRNTIQQIKENKMPVTTEH